MYQLSSNLQNNWVWHAAPQIVADFTVDELKEYLKAKSISGKVVRNFICLVVV